MPVVKIPAPYRGPTGGVDRVEVEGSTLRACIQAVADRFPGFGGQVWDQSCTVHRFVKLYINGDEIDRQAIDTPVEASDEVEVLAAVAGG
jgi:molybdopterin converting factor small subunit